MSGKQKGVLFSNLQQWSSTNGIGNYFYLGSLLCVNVMSINSLFKKMLMS